MRALLSLEGALARRVTLGSPDPVQVAAAVSRWEQKLQA